GLQHDQRYVVLTMHRPGNVDQPETLRSILRAAAELARDLPVILPAHPRTRSRIGEFALEHYVDPDAIDGAAAGAGRGRMISPVRYLDCLHLMAGAGLVLTDSGGVQEETTALGVPCLTLRDNTERPATLTAGTNSVVGTECERVVARARAVLRNGRAAVVQPPLWDGRAAERIVTILGERL